MKCTAPLVVNCENIKAVVCALGIGVFLEANVNRSQNSVAELKKYILDSTTKCKFYFKIIPGCQTLSFNYLPKWNLHISFNVCPSLSPPNNIITLRNLTAQCECKHPGPGFDFTGRHLRDTETCEQQFQINVVLARHIKNYWFHEII